MMQNEVDSASTKTTDRLGRPHYEAKRLTCLRFGGI
jgi:hypothetical protein